MSNDSLFRIRFGWPASCAYFKILHAILTIVAVSGLAGSAYAQQATVNSCINPGDYWTHCLNGTHGSHNDGRGSDRR
ncbi:conserved exported hypothetical protein [Mesorhizobium plurifarium]|uniref:Uncharacterized protein n=1 Tax=Mesorhizobium plurifarium TaxID=69974 RepID=A0A090GUV8_MESPL|nr:conserved exported hypothetical protein [Mesorhizobium plurifarium]